MSANVTRSFIGHDTLQHTCLNNYNKLDTCSQYRFQYHPTGTGVSYRWYWSFTYVVLECYLCGTGKGLICINQASQLMCSSYLRYKHLNPKLE